jgi:Cytochrome c oxidase subunit IV
MADEIHVSDPEAEEAGEAIHLPGPSYQPVVLAFGLTLAITGVVLFPIVAVIGGVIALVALIGWIRDTRREISELPLEH